jgi:hypothetical protein
MKYLILQENYSNYKELETYLKSHNIDISSWGKGDSKTIGHLFNELKNKECSISVENGVLIRVMEVVGLIVVYKNQRLKEDRQVFKDGRIRRRNMTSSCSEKMIYGENPIEAALRCSTEELDITLSESQLQNYTLSPDENESMSYPGLYSKYKKTHVYC